jgi:hypothetical protein
VEREVIAAKHEGFHHEGREEHEEKNWAKQWHRAHRRYTFRVLFKQAPIEQTV